MATRKQRKLVVRELSIISAVLSYFTVLPTWRLIDAKREHYKKSLKYFPAVGLLIGAVAFTVYILASYLFSNTISLFFSMVSTILFTRAMHEDGLADMCDGFGGGYTKDRILEIMKDSAIGVFGTVAIILSFACKLLALIEIQQALLIPIILLGHSTSRYMATTFLLTHNYARESNDSKAEINLGSYNAIDYSIMFITGLLAPLLLLFQYSQVSWQDIAILITVLIVVRVILGRLFTKKIDGYTGDTLGAAQQIFEITIYLTLCSIL